MRLRLSFLFALLMALLPPVAVAAPDGGEGPGFLISAREGAEGRVLPWHELEPGSDVESLERAVGAVVLVSGRLPSSPDRRKDLEAWARRLTSNARVLEGRVAAWVLDLEPEEGPSPTASALLFKRASVAIRGGDPGAPVFLGGDVASEGLEALFDLGLAAYLDGLVAPLPAGNPSAEAEILEDRDPTARLWFRAPPGAGGSAEILAAMEAGADGLAVEEAGPALRRVAGLLPTSFSVRTARLEPGGQASGLGLHGAGPPLEAVRLLDLESFATLVLCRSLGPAERGRRRLTVDVTDVGRPLLDDLETGLSLDPGLVVEEPRAGSTTFDLPHADGHLVGVRFAEAKLVQRGSRAERVRVSDEALPPVERILAAHQAWKAEQDARLESYVAKTATDMRFEVAASNRNADLGIRSRLYFRRDRPLEYENRQFFVNGVAIKRRKVPNIPLVQPEKVKTLPLELLLGKAYAYELDGKDEVAGRPAWVVAFEPLEGTTPAYRGEVWVDAETWARLRVHVVQTGLEPPVLSYEQTQHFTPVESDDGVFWLPGRSDVQQTFTTLGTTVTARAKTRYESYEINPPDVEDQLETARASEHQMLQETDEGLRYLVTDKETGERVLQGEATRKARFWLVGLRYDRFLDYPLPLGGFNLLNFDYRGKGIQTNAFLAGLFNQFSISDPSLRGSRWGAGADGTLLLIPVIDRGVSRDGQELPEADLRVLRENAAAYLQRPVGSFFQFTGTLSLDYANYWSTDDTADGFVAPPTHVTAALKGSAEFRRKGWNVDIWGEGAARSDWGPWGLPGGPGRTDWERARNYSKYGVKFSKDWQLPKFQTAGFRLEMMDGQDLDRFSRFRVGPFSAPLAGFEGSGLKWDRGRILRLNYGWNILSLAGLDLRFDWARIKHEEVSDDWFDSQGVALSGNFTGPRGGIITFDIGYGINSEIFPAAEGRVTFSVIFLKLL